MKGGRPLICSGLTVLTPYSMRQLGAGDSVYVLLVTHSIKTDAGRGMVSDRTGKDSQRITERKGHLTGTQDSR